jgi:protocatechuate 3,4-dioxygenase beta subunit
MRADDHRPDEHDLGLGHDLPTLLNRRRALGLLSGAGLAAALAACGGDKNPASTNRASGAPPSGGGGGPEPSVQVEDGEVPQETGGPYPADGTNGVNVLTESGIVRSDITRSFGEASGVATGVATTIALTILDMNDGDVQPYEGAAIYIWHCDARGRYSMYDQGAADENYLRGVQVADARGKVEFRSVFPAAYGGRWPHIHFEVYPSQQAAVSASDKLRTSQIALPEEAARKVYAGSGYAGSSANLTQTSLESDMVFADGYSLQMAKVAGSVDDGMTISLGIAV